MNKAVLVRKAKKALPYVLSGLSIAGVVLTGIFSAKATAKALEQIDKEDRDDTWKCYISTALIAIATAACIIGNGVLNRKKQASLVAAYTLLASNYKKYREKVKEEIGEEEEHKIASDSRISSNIEQAKKDNVVWAPSLTGSSTLDWGSDEDEVSHLFYDAFGKRFFTSTISRVLQAEIAVNRNMALGGWVSINDFYEFLGIEKIKNGGDEIGWCVCDGYTYLDFDHYKAQVEDTESGDNLEAYVIDYIWIPETEEALGLI